MAPAIANQTEVELNRGLDGKEFDYDNWVRNVPKNIRVFDARKHSLGPVEGELLNQAEIGARLRFSGQLIDPRVPPKV